MKYKKILTGSLFTFLSIGYSHGQIALVAAGGNETTLGGSVSYSVGQIMYQQYTSENVSVSEGVQQPFEVSVIASVGSEDFGNDISLFPNPTSSKLNITGVKGKDVSYSLFDLNGIELKSFNASNNKEIDLTDLTSAVYFLRVEDKNQSFKIFKIIKN